jgi:hypothetical protein
MKPVEALDEVILSLAHVPFSYVATSVEKLATFWREEYSTSPVNASVRTSDCSRSAQKL